MADTVTTQMIRSTPHKLALVLTGISDGTGETNVVKIDKSALTDANGSEPHHLVIDAVEYAINGMAVKLSFDHTADDTALVLSGTGNMYFESLGGLHDPVSSGGTGDLLLSTLGHSSGDTYTLMLQLRMA